MQPVSKAILNSLAAQQPEPATHTALTILLVADKVEEQQFIQQLLQQSRLSIKEVICTPSLEQCTAIIQQQRVDVVLFDLGLLNLTGPYSFRNILAVAGATPLIVLAALRDAGIALELIKIGAQDLLIKEQFDKDLLLRSIQYSVERKRIEKRLREANEKLHLVSKVTHDILWEFDFKTKVIIRDPEMLGNIFSPEFRFIKKDLEAWLEMVHPDDRPRLLRFINDIEQSTSNDIFEIEYRLLKKNGATIDVLDRGYVLRNEAGVPVKMLGAGQNISSKKRAEEELKRSEEKFRLLFNNNPFPTWVFDVETMRFLEVNDTAIAVYGYTRKEFLSMTGAVIRPEEERASFFTFYKNLVHNDIPQKKHWTHIKKSGEKLLVEVTTYPFVFNGSKAILAQVNDITESVRLKEELERQAAKRQQEVTLAVVQAEEKERTAIGEELHDNVNQLLAAAKLYMEMASRQDNGKEFITQAMSIVGQVIEEIRTLSKALVTPALQEAGLLVAIEEMADVIAMARGIQFTLNTKAFNEGRLSEELKLTLYRIIQEQLNNIVKHAGATAVTIHLVQDQSRVLLTVTDNGKGFDVHARRKGIGLSNIESRASLYNGTMEICSEPGKGCVLMVQLNVVV